MAKLKGLYQLRGKYADTSHYGQRYVEGTVVRQISDVIGERVKTGEEFAQVRLLNREFGAAAWNSKQLIDAIQFRKENIIKPFRSGIFTKEIAKLMRQDTTHDIGARSICSLDTSYEFARVMNSFSKRDPSLFGFGFEAKMLLTPSRTTIKVFRTPRDIEYLRSVGLTEFEVNVWPVVVSYPQYLPEVQKYSKPTMRISPLTIGTNIWGINEDFDETYTWEFSQYPGIFNYMWDTYFGGFIVTITGYRKLVGASTHHRVQNMCAYSFVPVEKKEA